MTRKPRLQYSMGPLTLTLDDRTLDDLTRLSTAQGISASEMASRLLARAVRAAHPRPVYDLEAIRAYAAEDLAPADSDPEHRAELLRLGDEAE